MLTYRDKRTGRVTDMHEGSDIKRETQEALRSARDVKHAEAITERGRNLEAKARHTLEKMDEAERWERLSDSGEIDRSRKAYERRTALRRGLPDPHADADGGGQRRSRQRNEAPKTEPEPDGDDAEGDGEPDDDGGRPSQGDPKADWIDYRVSQGIDRGDAESMTKNDLIDYDQQES